MAESSHGQRHDRTALILYGSETGNSQDIAEELGRRAERMHFITRVGEMDQFEINILLKQIIVIFIVSTTGQGEFPRNARKLWKSLLRKRLPPGCLSHVQFTIFGLGDSSYSQFNWAARKLHKRLVQLGAQEIYPRGESDEQHPEGIDGTFLSWSFDLGKHLLALYPLPDGVLPIPDDVFLPPKHFLKLVEEDQNSPTVRAANNSNSPPPSTSPSLAATHDSNSRTQSADQDQGRTTTSVSSSASAYPSNTNGNHYVSAPSSDNRASMDYTSLVQLEPRACEQLKEKFPSDLESKDQDIPESRVLPHPDALEATLVQNKRITPLDHWQDVRELTFVMAEDTVYFPGDILTIYPRNFPEDVQALIDLMGWNDVADKHIAFQATAPDYFLADNLTSMVPGLYPSPKPTLRQLLLDNLDITAIPKRSFFDFISHLTDDEVHKERLSEFSNPAYTDEFFDYATRPRRSILEVLQDFPSVKIPWKYATSIFPVIRGRQYSISSGGDLKHDPKNKDCVTVQLLVAIVKYRTVLKKVRQGLCSRYIASLPPMTVMNVGLTASTSLRDITKYQPDIPVILIGPGTGLAPLRSLIWQRSCLTPKDEKPRGETILFYGGRNKHADYFYEEEWIHGSLDVNVYTAFSRDQKEKVYVQDIIRQEKKLIYAMLRNEAVVYVCGSSGNMPKAVKEAIIDVIQECGECESRQKAEAVQASMVKLGLYIQETW